MCWIYHTHDMFFLLKPLDDESPPPYPVEENHLEQQQASVVVVKTGVHFLFYNMHYYRL